MTNDSNEELKQALRNLLAIERDRLLGYPTSELHMSPKQAIREADKALQEAGDDRDELILLEDREKLDL